MKFIIISVLLGILASPVYSQGNQSIFLAIANYMETTGLKFHEQCIEESGVDRALVDLLHIEAKWTPDPKLKCYIQCQGSKSEVMDENGIINVDTVKKVLKATNQKFLDMVDAECKLPQHPHLCEAAYLTSICIADILYGHHHLH